MAATRGRKYIFKKQKKSLFALSELCCGALASPYWQLLKLENWCRQKKLYGLNAWPFFHCLGNIYVIRLDIIVKSKSGSL